MFIHGGMILEIRLFYLNHQKQLRLTDYSKQMDIILETTSTVEKEAKHTSLLLNHLVAMIESRKNIKISNQ